MLRYSSGKTITLLRPCHTDITDQAYHFYEPEKDFGEELNYQIVTELVDILRELFTTVAEDLNIGLQLNELDIAGKSQIPGWGSRKLISNSDAIALINPGDEQLSYVIGCMRKNPCLCALLSYTHANYCSDFLEKRLEILGSQSLPLITETPDKLSRFFQAKITADNDQHMIKTIRDTLSYPYAA